MSGETESCPAACLEDVRERFVLQGIDAHVTTVPPLIPTGFEELGLTCPHGVRLYAEPTSEQRVAWASRGEGATS